MLIVVLPTRPPWHAEAKGAFRGVAARLVSECGHVRVNAMSHTIRSFLRMLKDGGNQACREGGPTVCFERDACVNDTQQPLFFFFFKESEKKNS